LRSHHRRDNSAEGAFGAGGKTKRVKTGDSLVISYLRRSFKATRKIATKKKDEKDDAEPSSADVLVFPPNSAPSSFMVQVLWGNKKIKNTCSFGEHSPTKREKRKGVPLFSRPESFD